ncbi:rhomboid-related protein 2-like isoform X2 [Euwallacea fornicatus]|uniref:rhomboid-related protein 2-like isoform X2 n=1 Tax=Euwallacea fornicatus TaxID=995702 RepID=UPI00338D8235
MDALLVIEPEDCEKYYQMIFDQLDTDRDGLIDLKQLKALDEPKRNLLPRNRIDDVIYSIGDDENITLSFSQFFKLMSFPGNGENRSSSNVLRYMGVLVSMTSTKHRSSENRADDPNKSIFLCVVMIGISVFQVASFFADQMGQTNWSVNGNGTISMLFIFEHTKRYQVWRFLTYMLVHVGYIDLFVNLSVQLLLGTYLEMMHGWCKVSILFFVGGLSGSLLSSSTDIWTRLAGSSGGVYALLTSHLIDIFLEKKIHIIGGYVQILIIGFLIGFDLVTSILARYFLSLEQRCSYVARIGGIATGTTLGVFLFNKRKFGNSVLWVCIIMYQLLIIAALLINIWPPQLDMPYFNSTLSSEIA